MTKQIKAAADVLRQHWMTVSYTPSGDFTSTCKTCGVLPDEPDVFYNHPAEMVLYAIGHITPEYTRD